MSTKQDADIPRRSDDQAATTAHLPSTSSGFYRNWDFWVIFLSSSLGFHAALLGTSPGWHLLLTDMPATLGKDKVPTLNWAFPTLLFAQAFSNIFFGRLSDYIGRRWIFVAGNLVAFVGFLSCSRVSHGHSISGLHVLIGLGTGIQVLGPFLALAELVPVYLRFAVTGGCVALLAPYQAVYPVIAEALTQRTAESWRWCYSINAIFSFVAFVGFAVAYNPKPLRQFDAPIRTRNWISLILIASSTCLEYFAVWGDRLWAWDSARVIAPIVVSGSFLLATPVYEALYGGDGAAIPGYLFRSWVTVSLVLSGALCVVFQAIHGRTGMGLAWNTSTFTTGTVAGSIIATAALFRPRRIKWHVVGGAVVSMVFLSALAAARPERYRMDQAFNTLIGIGVGYVLVTAYTAAPMTAKHRDMGCVVGTMAAVRTLVGCILWAVLYAIYLPKLHNDLVSNMAGALPPESIPALVEAIDAAQATGDPSGLLQVPGVTLKILMHLQLALVGAATSAFHLLICISFVYAALILGIAFASPNVDKYLSSEILAHNRIRGSSHADPDCEDEVGA
ncbi:fungal trichothecene efflux pump [Aspergillus multicolor]|uniref:fungal trichothecene efflux pump n=1 Tax=Aspergillus multicolor TaxID=41759 RepID=UPI003CCD7CF3